ncbi:hypothetical protein I4U23_008939 [Adineta vaga]|nr:hypothetical protein I4U23_008939 [Adineta vaga]
MTSWNSSSSCHPSSSHTGILPAYVYYYSYSPNLYQSFPSHEQSYVISAEQKQSQQITTDYFPHQNQWDISNSIEKSSYRTSVPFPSFMTRERNQFNLRTKKKYHRLDNQRSIQTLSVVTQLDHDTNEEYHSNNDFSIKKFSHILKNQSKNITNEELTDILHKLTNVMKNFEKHNHQEQQHQLPVLIDILNALLDVNSVMLTSVSQNSFFSICQKYLINLLQQWHRLGSLTDDESSTFRSLVKLANILTNSASLVPSWLSDSTLLDTIATCLTDIATTGKFLDHNNKYHFKHFTHLIETYTLYQQYLNQHNHFNKDTFIQLLHPIQQCLTSNHFINTFTNLSTTSNSLTTVQKFLLLKSPAFLTSYNGPALEETMHQLLSTMLSHYVTILGQAMKSCAHWSQSMIRCVESILATINHGTHEFPNNVKMMSDHLALIDHVLKLLDEPILYNNVNETLSNGETMLLNSAMRFLVLMMSEPNVLAHMKESHAAQSFLRLTSCKNEGVVLNAYTLLANAIHEDDIKLMLNLDQLLAKIIQSLKLTLKEKSDKKNQTKQLLGILKGKNISELFRSVCKEDRTRST